MLPIGPTTAEDSFAPKPISFHFQGARIQMPNDSSTGGVLLPSSPAPQSDADLDAIIQSMVVSLTGLQGSLVRPRWQPVTPKMPEVNVNWCAIGVTGILPDANSAIIHNSDGLGSDTLYRHELISVLASFYGPAAQHYASQCRDGLWLPQNNSMLRQYNMGFIDAGPIRVVPELINHQWRRRYDFSITLRRQVVRTYSVLNLDSANIELTTANPYTDSLIEVDESGE
jgi:hypothetical protein